MSESSDTNDHVGVALLDRDDFAEFVHDGNFCVYLKLVHDRKEAEEDIKKDTFYPDFVHQFFLNQERIFGYTKPVIRLFYSASRLKRYVKFDYDKKVSKETHNIEPDDVMECLSPVLDGLEYTQDLGLFMNEVESKEEKEFKPPGDLLYEFETTYKKPALVSRAQIEQRLSAGEAHSNGTLTNGFSNGPSNGSQQAGASSTASEPISGDATDSSGCRKKFQIFHCNSETVNFSNFQARMQSLVMWFIESATMVDFQDPRWDFFLIFERYNPSLNEDPQATPLSSDDRYYFAGYASVYRYYAYPDRTRPRVSQMLILPSYRRNRLGTALLQSIYDFYVKQPSTLDITAEDPDEEFIAMRDFLDCKNCMGLAKFKPDALVEGWSEATAKEAQEKLKLCQRQSRKVYEILKLMSIDKSNEEEHRKYRLEIKNRLNIPNQRMKLDCDKVLKRGFELPDELRIQRENQKLSAAQLDENYQELIKQYQHTIDKLNHHKAEASSSL